MKSRAGFEIELLAPRGANRRDLAMALAETVGGSVRPLWHEASEPVPVDSIGGRFLHLTQGFEVRRGDGGQLCTLVDDVTIVSELDARAPAPPGWHRLLTDDQRLVRLLARHCDPGGPLDVALDGMAALWGELPDRNGNVWRLETAGATIALAAPAGGERERPCEVITPPLTVDHGAALDGLLATARALNFTVPVEAAVHIHLDGGPFRSAHAIANLIRLFAWWREPLRAALGTNPHCRRLAPLPEPLVELVQVVGEPQDPDLATLRRVATESGLSKFFDVNLTQLLGEHSIRDTVEIRILPGTAYAAEIMARAELLERLLDRCREPAPIPRPPADPTDAAARLSCL